MAASTQSTLFGGQRGWHSSDWTASDDRVRGGRSHSYLKIDNGAAIFYGNLDIDTLGGAGFASQRTTGDDRHWDLSQGDALELLIDSTKSDGKRYTLILKDEILPRNPENGREQSSTSWEYDFQATDGVTSNQHAHLKSIVVPWAEFKPTYRGKDKDPGRALNLTDIRRISIMMRSFFGDQKGSFTLNIVSVAVTSIDHSIIQAQSLEMRKLSDSTDVSELKSSQPKPASIWTRIMSLCNKL